MKKGYSLILMVLLALAGFSQGVPQMINYQGVARSGNGVPMANRTISVKFEILSGSVAAYSQTQSGIVTNALGLFNTQIGKPAGISGVNWGTGTYFLQVSIDTLNGTNLLAVGAPQQIVSVPYALYAGSAPDPTLNFNPATSILTVGQNTANLTSNNAAPNLSISGSTISITSGSNVVVPSPTITGTGATNVTPSSGLNFTVHTDSVKVTPYTNFPIVSGGLLSIYGSYPNYSLAVQPGISYSSISGSLTLTNPQTSLGASYNITPALQLSGPFLYSGPTSNVADFTNITPWRQATATTVTLAVSTASTCSVGINVSTPTAELHVKGYTKLGDLAPAIQVATITGSVPPINSSISYTFSNYPAIATLTQNKIISVTVMADASTNSSFDWIPPGYINSVGGYEFYWRVTNNTIVIETRGSSNSQTIVGHAVKIMITYTP